ncbi:hypothetical protein BP6252_04981 [Coleophoma cylindrospora]|uniref:Pyrroline-5-carboxylate reductase n=1 Tax=Coleophoma cylindrospora TaxID=1849047 RepID=A0A3D8RSI8_9HELO|nr:hypothetical protein BP6252_04981 [Coleophoma cylindrospora]
MAAVASEHEFLTMRLGLIGCGSLGTAILQGINTDNNGTKPSPVNLENCAISVKSEDSARLLRNTFSGFNAPLSVYAGDNIQVVEDSDIILLAVPPDDVCDVLSTPGMRGALQGKLLVSLAAGVTRSQINTALYGDSSATDSIEDRCHVMRAMPNLAASVGQSMSALNVSNPPPPQQLANFAQALFEKIGTAIYVPEQSFDACTFLCGSTPAAVALFCDAMIDGAVAAGVSRKAAQPIIVQILKSAAALMQNGQSPSDLREHVCAQPGCTIGAMMVLEKGGARGVIAGATHDGILLASKLGQKTP